MEIARAIKDEGRDARRELTIKFFDQSRRGRETQLSAPISRVEHGQFERLISPGVVEIEMKSLAQNYFGARGRKRLSLCLAMRRFSAASVRFGSIRKASSYSIMACDVLPSRRSKLPRLLWTSARLGSSRAASR